MTEKSARESLRDFLDLHADSIATDAPSGINKALRGLKVDVSAGLAGIERRYQSVIVQFLQIGRSDVLEVREGDTLHLIPLSSVSSISVVRETED